MQINQVDITTVIPYVNNPRKNTKAIASVADSIKQFGFQQPIVVDKHNVIVAGHTRYAAAKTLKLKQIPVLVADSLTDEQCRQYRIADNRTSEDSAWDDKLLLQELQALLHDDDIQQLSYNTGFTESELNKLFGKDDNFDLDKYLTPTPTITQPGDMWTLGDHKLICGDSTSADTYAVLLNTEQIDMLWEDPPYGVSYISVDSFNKSQAEKDAQYHKIANDNLTVDQLDKFLVAHIQAVDKYVKPGAPVYWCHDIDFNHQFKSVLEQNGYHVTDTLIWKKNKTSSFLSNHAKIYEPILYGWKKGQQHPWYGRAQQNVFQDDVLATKTLTQLIEIIKSFDTNYQQHAVEPRSIAGLHPTVKPVSLIVNHVINSSRQGEIVFDGFSGSGSTLIACEKTNRHARCIELEPKFCDVTINRWQELTGQKAVRQDGVLYDDVQPQKQAPVDHANPLDALPTEATYA